MHYNDVIGTVGVSLILMAYILNVFSVITKNGVFFFVLNLIGAGLACYASVLIQYTPFIILEGVWALVSAVALVQYQRLGNKAKLWGRNIPP
jgi:hypothetical protein